MASVTDDTPESAMTPYIERKTTAFRRSAAFQRQRPAAHEDVAEHRDDDPGEPCPGDAVRDEDQGQLLGPGDRVEHERRGYPVVGHVGRAERVDDAQREDHDEQPHHEQQRQQHGHPVVETVEAAPVAVGDPEGEQLGRREQEHGDALDRVLELLEGLGQVVHRDDEEGHREGEGGVGEGLEARHGEAAQAHPPLDGEVVQGRGHHVNSG